MTIIIINKVIKGGTVRDASHGETPFNANCFSGTVNH